MRMAQPTTNQKCDSLCNCFYCLMTIKSLNSHICLTLYALWCFMSSVVHGLFPWTGTLTVYCKLSKATVPFPLLSQICIFQLHSGTHHTHQSNMNGTIWLCIDGMHVQTSACMTQWCCCICFCPRVQWKYDIQCQIIGWLHIMNSKGSTWRVMIYFKVLSQNLHAGTCRTMKTLDQDRQSLGRVSNLEPPAYEAGVPSTWLWYLE
jgi:hypothetical protein